MSTNNKKPGKSKFQNLTQAILNAFKPDENSSLNYKQICAKLSIRDTSGRNQVIKKLHQLKAKGQIEEIDPGKFKIIKAIDHYTGKIDISSRGTGYVITNELQEDIMVPRKSLGQALNGDSAAGARLFLTALRALAAWTPGACPARFAKLDYGVHVLSQ